MIASFIFYMLSIVLIASAIATVTVKQPVTAVLCMILCFFNAAGLFLFLGAEFLSFILLIVYVGAVAVLFLFVVMMLDMKENKKKVFVKKYALSGLTIGFILLMQLFTVSYNWSNIVEKTNTETTNNTHALGAVLYVDYAFLFQIAGLILLTSMIGAIVLTIRKPRSSKRQNYKDQIYTKREDVVKICKVKTGEGAL